MIGSTDPKDWETEDSLCAGILRTLNGVEGLRYGGGDGRSWRELEWSDEVFWAFWGAVRTAFEVTKERRA